MKSTRMLASLFGIAGLAALGAVWTMRQRNNPAACPFGQRFFLDLPRPFMRRETLVALLEPAPRERVLEIGPGTGYYSLDIVPRLAPGGQLDLLDIQQPMLDEVRQRAASSGIANIQTTRGDAQALPFPDATFDAAFLVATLGEIPDKGLALREVRRVLKPDGRLVVGEGQPDPHMVASAALRALAIEAGFRFERHEGNRFGFLARFRVA